MYQRQVSLGIAGAVCSAVGCLADYLFDSGPAPAKGDDSKPADVPEIRFHLMARSPKRKSRPRFKNLDATWLRSVTRFYWMHRLDG
jgi:hypothetical protein